nr:hydrogen gas-evolving membrane-bound hydrogenase subunit E [uncultured Halomonas sp.]
MNAPDTDSAVPLLGRLLLAIALIGIALVLGWTLWHQANAQTSLTAIVMTELPNSGVTNPVTAVLLNFRAFDTMLELAVLLLVAVTAGMLREYKTAPSSFSDRAVESAFPSPLLLSLARDLTPVMILVSAYLLWVGAKEPGGAFQAGAVLASAGVLAHFSGRPWLSDHQDVRIRALLVLGTGAFLISALAMLGVTGTYFDYPLAWAGAWILAIETAATLSIAAMLYVAFCAVMPSRERP